MATITCPHCSQKTGVMPPFYKCEHCQKSLKQAPPIVPPPLPSKEEKTIFDAGSNDKPVDKVVPVNKNANNEPTIFDSSGKKTPPPLPENKPNFLMEDIFGKEMPPPPPPKPKDITLQEDNRPSNYQQYQNEKAEQEGRQRAAWLIVHTKDKPTVSYTLYVGENIFGRPSSNYECDIPIDDEYVSRSHAVICIEQDSFGRFSCHLLDDGAKRSGKASSNGTFINGNAMRVPMKGKAFLFDGDAIQVGYTGLVFKSIEVAKNVQEAVSKVQNMEYTRIVDLHKMP